MNIFFHHVGQDGADRDFPKTVFQKHNIDLLVSRNILTDKELIQELKNQFPKGEFNCWGVPVGANTVIKNLQVGDCVLLVRSARIDGDIPALCLVKVFWRHNLDALSHYLWQDSKYPYIFFFDTIEIELLWMQFMEAMAYNNRFSPRGNFYQIKSDRLTRLGGTENYVSNLINGTILYKQNVEGANTLNEIPIGYNSEVQDEETNLISQVDSEPQLTNGSTEKRLVAVTKRDQAFSNLVKQNYDHSCAICSSNLKSPKGHSAVHAAHIFPKEENGSDDLRNGICFCFLHHWAFDTGWLTIDDNYCIVVRKEIPQTEEYRSIHQWDGEKIKLPTDKNMWPHKIFLEASRQHYGFSKQKD